MPKRTSKSNIYVNASNVLPFSLIREIQKYHTGFLYIPSARRFYESCRQLVLTMDDKNLSIEEISRIVGIPDKEVRQIIDDFQPVTKDWQSCEKEQLIRPGRPKNESDLTSKELHKIIKELGGVSTVAKKVGCSRRTLYNYINDKRKPNEEITGKISALQKKMGKKR